MSLSFLAVRSLTVLGLWVHVKFLCFHLQEAAGAGRACRADEGPSALGAEGAEGSAGAAAEGLGEDKERQPGLDHVLREVRL